MSRVKNAVLFCGSLVKIAQKRLRNVIRIPQLSANTINAFPGKDDE